MFFLVNKNEKSMYYADSDTVHCVVVEKLNFPKYSFFFAFVLKTYSNQSKISQHIYTQYFTTFVFQVKRK